MRIEGKIISKQMMKAKDKEVGYVKVKVLWALEPEFQNADIDVKVDVFTTIDEDLEIGKSYFIKMTHLGTILKAVSFQEFSKFE